MNKFNIFDIDFLNIKRLTWKYLWIVIVTLITLLILLIFLKKEKVVIASFNFIDGTKAYVEFRKVNINSLDNIQKVIINEISYDFSIEMIEEKDDVYVMMVLFKEEIKTEGQICRLFLGKESMIGYIIRIIKGE